MPWAAQKASTPSKSSDSLARMAGTASAVADRMIDWFDSKACDGFNLNAPFNPGGFKLICDKLVPELQNRGYFRTEYEGATLRDNFGLSYPSSIRSRV